MSDGLSCMPGRTIAEEVTDSYCSHEDRAKETILLVEDEAFVREVMSEVLRGAGYCVLSAKDSAEAEGWYKASSKIDLLITDLILPGGNGRILAEKVRKRKKLRVLFVTGYAEQLDLPNEDAVECLAKPFSRGALLETVRRVLEEQECDTVARICREWAHVAQEQSDQASLDSSAGRIFS